MERELKKVGRKVGIREKTNLTIRDRKRGNSVRLDSREQRVKSYPKVRPKGKKLDPGQGSGGVNIQNPSSEKSPKGNGAGAWGAGKTRKKMRITQWGVPKLAKFPIEVECTEFIVAKVYERGKKHQVGDDHGVGEKRKCRRLCGGGGQGKKKTKRNAQSGA